MLGMLLNWKNESLKKLQEKEEEKNSLDILNIQSEKEKFSGSDVIVTSNSLLDHVKKYGQKKQLIFNV